MKITFDTNIIDRVCRPERFPNDHLQPYLKNMTEALSKGKIQGYYSVTMLTIEGIMRTDRAKVFSGTNIKTETEIITPDYNNYLDSKRGDKESKNHTIELVKLKVEQPDRKPLHREVVARANAAHRLGVRVLKTVPRIGAYQIDDPEMKYYLSNGTGQKLETWQENIFEVSRAIEERKLGFSQVKVLGDELIGEEKKEWYHNLANANDIHKKRKVERAFSEWADGDSVASHIAYGLDMFCTSDKGKSNAMPSVLDDENKNWIASTYGVKFVTLDELLQLNILS